MAYRRRLIILLTIVSIIAAITVPAEIFCEYRLHRAEQVRTRLDLVRVTNTLHSQLEQHTETMAEIIEFLKTNPNLQHSFQARDRSATLRAAKPLFEQIRNNQHITHFYFHDPERVNFLRVHEPAHHGDLIDETTMLLASQNNAPAAGIELGPSESFTLRVVYPWWNDGKLLGYIELGVGIDRVIAYVQETLGVELFFCVEKKYLDRKMWSMGRKTPEETADWDELPHRVIVSRTLPTLPLCLAELPQHPYDEDAIPLAHATIANRQYRSGIVPFTDANGTRVGDIVCLLDLPVDQPQLHALILWITIASVLLGVVLCTSLWFLLGWIDRTLGYTSERYHTIFYTSSDAVMTLEPPNWKFTAGNPATVKMFGVKNEAEFISLGPWDLSPEFQPDGCPSAEKAKLSIEQAVQNGSHAFEWQHMRYRGVEFPASVLLTKCESHGRVFLQATVRDLTEQRQAESSLRTLDQAVQQSSSTIVITDARGNIEYANPQFERTTGYTIEESLGRNPRFLKSEHQPPEFYHDLWSTITSGKQWRGEFLNRRKDGTLFWETACISPVTDDGKRINHFVAVKDDVTDRKQAELEREQHLRDMRKRIKEITCLRDIVNALHHGKRLNDVTSDLCTILPRGYQHTDITRVRLIVDGTEYTAEPFTPTVWKQTSEIVVEKEHRGMLEVYYLEERPLQDEGPFLKEERQLLQSTTKTLEKAINEIRFERQQHDYVNALAAANTSLEQSRDADRQTHAALAEKLREVESFNRLSVGRELKMIALKTEINEMLIESGMAPKYEIAQSEVAQ